jgi:IS6 family transposase
MADSERTCPECGSAATRKDGRDRRGQQRFRCRACRRRFTSLTGTPFAGYRFPPDIIALAVRWYLRFRLSYADVAELLAERGVRVDPSTIFAWVREFAPLYEDAARSFRRAIGSNWSVDETYTKVAGKPAYVYRAIDGQGQVVDVYVSLRRATADATTFFRRAIEATGVIPDEVATDGAATYPPALAAALPPVAHETGKLVQQRIERDHQHLKGRLRPMRGFKTLAGARVLCRAHAFLRNLRGGFYDLGHLVDDVAIVPQPPVVWAWAALTGTLLVRCRPRQRTFLAAPAPVRCVPQSPPHNSTEPGGIGEEGGMAIGEGRRHRRAPCCQRNPSRPEYRARAPPRQRPGLSLHLPENATSLANHCVVRGPRGDTRHRRQQRTRLCGPLIVRPRR